MPPEHRHPDRLEVLERPGEVEERLRPGADRDHVMVGEGIEVGGDVAGELGPRWTPPMPPVANTETPAAAAMRHRRRHRRGAELPALGDRHRDVALGHLAGRPEDAARPRRRRRPTRTVPSSTAVTAGIAPPSRIAAAQRSSASRLAGDGRPRLEKIVDSSATTGAPSASAVATSSEQVGVITVAVCHHRECPPGDRPGRTCSRRCEVREPGDRLDVRGVREQVEHLDRFRHVAALGHQGDVVGERHRVAADEHEHRRAPPRSARRRPACRARSVPGRPRRRRRAGRIGPPSTHLRLHDRRPVARSGCAWRRSTPTSTTRSP